MKALTYDRLVYYDIDTRRYSIKAGIGKGELYTPQSGDFLIDIDTGKNLPKTALISPTTTFSIKSIQAVSTHESSATDRQA